MTNIDKIISIIIGFYFKSDPHSKFFTSSVTLNCIRLVSWTSKERTIEILEEIKKEGTEIPNIPHQTPYNSSLSFLLHWNAATDRPP